MVTDLKLTKDLKNASLKELVSSLRSHEIELDQDEPQKKVKSVALKSTSGKTKAYQAKEESEESEKDSDDEEFSLISRRISQIWKHRQRKSRNQRRTYGRDESTFGQKNATGK